MFIALFAVSALVDLGVEVAFETAFSEKIFIALIAVNIWRMFRDEVNIEIILVDKIPITVIATVIRPMC